MRSLPLVFVLALVPTLAAAAQPSQTALHLSPVFYELDMSIDYDRETIIGAARITVKNHSTQSADEVSLILYRLLTVEAIRTGSGQPLPFSQRVTSFEDFPTLQVNHVRIPLDQSLAPGDTTIVQVAFGGYLLGYTETGMSYIRDRVSPEFTILRDDARAFPMPGYPSVAVNRSAPMPSYHYLARIAVPDSLIVANGGKLVETRSEGGRTTFVYKSQKPSWRMDFAIAPYRTIETPPLRIFYFPADSAGARAVGAAAVEAFNTFESWFGPLHNAATLSVIEIPDGWGSQADATAIIQSAAAFRDSTRHREVFHEISHLWNVTPRDLPSPRWNEGLASFLEYLMWEQLSGVQVVDERMDALLRRLRKELPTHSAWSTVPLVRYGEEGMTDLSYSVGALFFDQLYRLVGASKFNAIIGSVYAQYAESGASTDDLRNAIEHVAGSGMRALINDWIYTTAWVERIEQIASVEELTEYYRDRAQSEADQ